MRIARFLARCGAASRRHAEEFVTAGRVTLNGEVITDLGRQVNPDVDVVTLDGHPMKLPVSHLTIAIHKPVGVIVSRRDPQGRQTIYDLLPISLSSRQGQLVPVGRLDYMTSGLILMTTDGELAARLAHPKCEVSKVYRLTGLSRIPAELAEAMADGVELEDGRTMPCSVFLEEPSCRSLVITLKEGRNRQIRRMAEVVGLRIKSLERIAIGDLTLEGLDLAPGGIAELSIPEIRALFR